MAHLKTRKLHHPTFKKKKKIECHYLQRDGLLLRIGTVGTHYFPIPHRQIRFNVTSTSADYTV